MINVQIVKEPFDLIGMNNLNLIADKNLYNKYKDLIDTTKYKIIDILNTSNDNTKIFEVFNDLVKHIILDYTNNILTSEYLKIDSTYKVLYLLVLEEKLFLSIHINPIEFILMFIYNDLDIESKKKEIYTNPNFFNNIVEKVYATITSCIKYKLLLTYPVYYLNYNTKIEYDNAIDIFNYLDIDNIEDTITELKYNNEFFNKDSYKWLEVIPNSNIVNLY